MSLILTEKTTNYKQWAFLLFIIIVLVSIVEYFFITYFTISLLELDLDIFIQFLNIMGIATTLMMLTGIILTILSIVKKETKNYQFYISIVGYPLLIFQTALVIIQSTQTTVI